MYTYILADRLHKKLVTLVALGRVFERGEISGREIYFYYVFFLRVFAFLPCHTFKKPYR